MFDNTQFLAAIGCCFNDVQGDLYISGLRGGSNVEMTSRTTPAQVATTNYPVATSNDFPNQIPIPHAHSLPSRDTAFLQTTEHRRYELFCLAMSVFVGLMAALPFVPFPSPFHTIPQGSVGCIFYFGRLSKITDLGLAKANACTETLQVMTLMLQDVPCVRQVVITRDHVRVEINLDIHLRIVDPYLAVTQAAHPQQAIVECTKARAVVTNRKPLIREVLEDVGEFVNDWGIAVGDISIADVQLP